MVDENIFVKNVMDPQYVNTGDKEIFVKNVMDPQYVNTGETKKYL